MPLLKQKDELELRRRIADGSQDADDYLDLADLLFSGSRDEEAIFTCKQALNLPLTPFQEAKVSVALGWIYFELVRQTEAIAQAESAIGLLAQEVDNVEVVACRGRSQSLLALSLWWGQENEDTRTKEAARVAIEYYEQVIERAPDFAEKGEVHYEVARLYNLLGNNRIAIEHCKRCLESELEERERLACLNLLAECYRSEGQLSEADTTVQEAFLHVHANEGTLPALYFTHGLVQRSLNLFAEARQSFEQAIEALKGDRRLSNDVSFFSDIYFNIGELDYYSDKPGEALRAFEKIIAYYPNDNRNRRNALLWIGWCYQATEEYQRAIDSFKKVLGSPDISENEKTSASQSLAWNQGKIHYGVEEYREAAVFFQEVLGYQVDDDRDRYNTLLWLGHCYFAIGEFVKARDCYSQVTLSPHAADLDKEAAREALSYLSQSPRKPVH